MTDADQGPFCKHGAPLYDCPKCEEEETTVTEPKGLLTTEVEKCPATHPGDPVTGRCTLARNHKGGHRVDVNVHRCHAKGCVVPVKPEMLMCLRHWRMVPHYQQKAVLRAYRIGQCDDKQVSKEWLRAADLAVKSVAEKEARR